MFVYITMLALWGITAFCAACSPFYFNRDNDQYHVIHTNLQRKIMLFYAISLIIIIGLRDEQVGSDTIGYMRDYLYWGNIEISNLKFSLDIELGYKCLQRIFTILGLNWQQFLFFTAIVMIGCFSFLVKKYSCYAFAPYFLYVTIGLFAMNMTGIRQSLAVALCLIAYYFAEKRKKLLFFLCVAIAVTIHSSALCFFPIYFIFFIKKPSKKILSMFLFLPVATRLSSLFLNQILYHFAFGRYIGNGYFDDINLQLNILAELFPLSILLLGYVFLIIKSEIASREFHLFIMTSIYASAYQLTHAVYMAGRLNFYFSPFMVLFLGNIIFSIKDSRVRFFSYAAMIFVSIMFFCITIPNSSYRMNNYMFFWN